MAWNSLSIINSPLTKTSTVNEHHGISRVLLVESLCYKSKKMARAYSDHHLCYSVNRIRIMDSAMQPNLKTNRSFEIFNIPLSNSIIPNSLRSLLFYPETIKRKGDIEDADTQIEDNDEYAISDEGDGEMEKRVNWIERLMEIRTHWRDRQNNERVDDNGIPDKVCGDEGDECGCGVEYDDKEEEESEISVDQVSFSNLLDQVASSDTKTFARLALLSNMAYAIPDIKADDLKRSYNLDFITSSLEKKAEAAALLEKFTTDVTPAPLFSTSSDKESNDKNTLSPEEKTLNRNAAYEVAASAASYVHSCAKDFLSLRSGTKQDDQRHDGHEKSANIEDEEECLSPKVKKSEVAAHVAASTMTVVVAAGETEKQKTAKDLRSPHSSPCEWFICDDPSTYARCFVIQGSESFASWQANLFFEPTKFEDMEALVHRGIYEAAKGIYKQFMPQVMEHINKYGDRAKLQFTGHSLGGSLALLVNLMLLTRKVVNPSALRPIVTFGSPFVFCGGEKVLEELGVNEDSVQCVMLHRDIVPRAFTCNYPNHVARILKGLSGSFRTHPCLNKEKLLYSPLGKIFILQPDQKVSPPHPFLPPGTALYAFRSTKTTPQSFLKNSLRAFLNTPHPLETLSDPKAYTSEGTIKRDHDSSNYLKAINAVIRQVHVKIEMKMTSNERKKKRWLHKSQYSHAWGYDIDLEGVRLVSTEVMTSV